MGVFAANVCRRFFKYLFWYFCSSAIEPLSACILSILFGDIDSSLDNCCRRNDGCSIVVATDDSDSLDVLDDEWDGGSGCWLNFNRVTLIFGDGVNAELLLLLLLFDDDDGDDDVLSVDEKLLTLLLVFAYKFRRLSVCTLFSTTRMVSFLCCNNSDDTCWPFSSSSSSSMCGNVNGKWLCEERAVEETLDGDDCCALDKFPDVDDVTWFIVLELGDDAEVNDGGEESSLLLLTVVGIVDVVKEEEEEEQEEEEQVEEVGNWFNALVSAANDDDSSCWWYCLESASSGVVKVGELDDDVVTDEVVMPINVVVTTAVSISGDESAVKVV